jgi:cytochrome c oxidase cbb3-type subunit 4
MDINDLRSLVTVLAFLTFVGIVLWAYNGRRRAAFEEAAKLPFTEDDAAEERAARKEGKTS